MQSPDTLHARLRKAVHAAGIVMGILIAVAAAWMIARDHQHEKRIAALHLENLAAVLAEQTRLALLKADPGFAAAAGGKAERVDAQSAVQRHFSETYSGLGRAYAGRGMLFRDDAVLLATAPPPVNDVGRSFRDHPLFASTAAPGGSGVIEAAGVLDSGARLIAYRRVTGHPMIVAVSAPMQSIVARWSGDAAAMAFGALVFAALSAAGSSLLGRQLRVNEALAREIAENELRLNSIISSAMDAVITVDEDQKIILFNAAAQKIFRCSADEAIGTSLDRFIPARFRDSHREHVRRFGEAGVTVRRMGAELVLSGLRADGEEFPIDASISHTSVAGRRFYTVILRDVTGREQAAREQREVQRKLEESEQRLQSIIGSAMDAIITLDEEQKVVLFNAAAERIFGCPVREAIGSSIDRFVPQRFREAHRTHVRRFGEAGVTMRRMGGDLVLAGLRANGEEFPIDASISHATVAGRRFYTVILRDITERQRAAEALARSHQELRETYEAMHEVREAERTRIARELHDELAQWLTALKMDASWIATRLPREQAPLVAKAERMKGVVDNTVAAVRRIAADLRPVMLDDLGVVPAIESLLSDLAERTGIAITLEGDDGVDLEEPLATAIYRMVQEALTNVARHSGASAVSVALKNVDEHVEVRVCDNGSGLKPDPNRKSYGILGIRERARTLGGEARIYSPPEGGTIVHIRVPTAGYARRRRA